MAFPLPWTTSAPWGSLWSVSAKFVEDDEVTLTNITGKVFEVVLRTTARDTGTPAAKISSVAPTASGYITVNTATSTILMVLSPTATAALKAGQVYAVALYMDPGLSTQQAAAVGLFAVTPVAAAA